MSAFDIGLTDDFDLTFSNGDFSIRETTEQHIFLTLGTAQGHWKQFPLNGARIIDALNGPTSFDLEGRIKQQLEFDGMRVDMVSYAANGDLDIDGEY